MILVFHFVYLKIILTKERILLLQGPEIILYVHFYGEIFYIFFYIEFGENQ
jgi:hypothetical protein